MKTVSIISIVYGILGMFWAVLVGFSISMHQAVFEQVPWPPELMEILDFPTVMEAVYGILDNLFPFVYLIAILYIVSGILQLAGKQAFKALAYAAAILNILWYLAYAVMIHTDLLPLLNEMEFMPEGLMNGLFLAGLLINAVFYCSYPVFLIVYVARGGKEWDTLDTGYTS